MRRLMPLLLALVMLGCAGRTAPPTVPAPPPLPTDPWSWLPGEGASTVGHVALEPLRASALWPLLGDLQKQPQLALWVEADKISRVVFAGRSEGEERESAAGVSYVAALEGRFVPDELRALAARDGVAAEPRGRLTLYRRADAVWTQITPTLLLACSADRVDALVARADRGPGVPVHEAAVYRSLAGRVGLEQADLGLIAEDPEGKGRALLDRRASGYGLEALRDAVRLGVGLDVGPAYHLQVAAETPDAPRAQALEQDARQALQGLSENLVLRMLGFGSLLAKLRVESEGSYVFVRGQLPEREVATALERVQGAFKLAPGARPALGAP